MGYEKNQPTLMGAKRTPKVLNTVAPPASTSVI